MDNYFLRSLCKKSLLDQDNTRKFKPQFLSLAVLTTETGEKIYDQIFSHLAKFIISKGIQVIRFKGDSLILRLGNLVIK